MKASRILLFFFCTIAIHVNAQNFGAFPSTTKWRQINSDTARVIFTPAASHQAQRIATLLHAIAADSNISFGDRLRKINVVLHNRTTLANAYVGLAPFRSEFYLVPASNLFEFGTLPWHENLAIHEYRHVQQYNHFRKGISAGFYYLFGERGQALANGLAVPDWFWEGDAVYAETALTSQGRGRLSYFQSGYNSLWTEGKNYSWMKLRNGSLKDYVPNHYQLGYLLVQYGYQKYGPSFWEKVTGDAVRFKGILYPFQQSVKRNSGVPFKTFRKEALDYYRRQVQEVKAPHYAKHQTVTNYYFPTAIGEDSLLYLKTGYDRLPAFYLKDRAGEHRISLRSISTEEWFSYRNGTIAYTAYSTHPRWSLVDHSDIVLLDVNSKKETRLTKGEKYFTPDLSPSGNMIAAIVFNDSLQTELRILDRNNGSILHRLAGGPELFFSQPRFIDEKSIVMGIRTQDAKMTLARLDLDGMKTEPLFPYSYHTVGYPRASGNRVYFTANFKGNDDLYAVDLGSKDVVRLTSGATGHYYVQPVGDSLQYARYTAGGLALQKISFSDAVNEKIGGNDVTAPLAIAPSGVLKNLSDVRTERFSERRYPKSTGLFNFHSWSPDYSVPIVSLSLYSDNILNTFSNTVFYRYNTSEMSHAVGWNTSYGGWFARINAGSEFIGGRRVATSLGMVNINQLETRLGYNIPLSFTKGKMSKFLNFGSSYNLSRVMPAGILKDSFRTQTRSYLSHFVSWSHQLPRAVQQIYPRFGYSGAVQHRHVLDGSGYQVNAGAQVSLPSFRNHSIVLGSAFQQTDTTNLLFANRFAGSRGYSDFDFQRYSRMWRVSANYHFPLAYPDWGVANIVYLQRLRGNLFYDVTRVFAHDRSRLRDVASTGAELFFDTQWWNMVPITIGIRYAYLLDPYFEGSRRTHRIELALPLDLIPD